MTKHPLTESICQNIGASIDLPFPYSAIATNNMQRAADWQLEQVIQWLDGRYMGEDVLSVDIIKGLIEAMRPTANQILN